MVEIDFSSSNEAVGIGTAFSDTQLCNYSSDSIGTWIIYGFLNLIVVH